MITVEQFAKHFDMAVLKQNTQEASIREAGKTAAKYHLAALYTCPCWTSVVAEELSGSDVATGVGIAFPYGTLTTKVKMFEIEDALENGATTVDMVINIGALKDKNYNLIRREAQGLVEATKDRALSKLILEVGFLTDEEIAVVSKIGSECGVDYLKTATGTEEFPSEHQVGIMLANSSGKTKVKVSGVPRTFTLAGCLWMIERGVSLIGTRSAVKLVDEYRDYLAESR
ncbi:MAG: deoxyribose-phosphate aldolase [Synergistaceae bacterium]|jgi:deoxyribose-phosphate aldolase|nr:deoxyribose-phosphate aldolase [Synergistaceae bacterium]